MAVGFQHRPLLTIAQTAERLAISEKSVRRLITAGVLPCSKIGGVFRISPEELEEWVGSSRVSGEPRSLPADVGLAEALEVTLLILAKEPTRFRATELHWHARYCDDNKVSMEEATAVLGCWPCSRVGEVSQRPRLLRVSSTAAPSCQPPRL